METRGSDLGVFGSRARAGFFELAEQNTNEPRLRVQGLEFRAQGWGQSQ